MLRRWRSETPAKPSGTNEWRSESWLERSEAACGILLDVPERATFPMSMETADDDHRTGLRTSIGWIGV